VSEDISDGFTNDDRDTTWLRLLDMGTRGSSEENLTTWENFKKTWKNGVSLPTGVSIRNHRGKRGHMSHSQRDQIKEINLIATRFFLTCCEIGQDTAPSIQHPKWRLPLQFLKCEDAICVASSVSAMLAELERNHIQRRLLATEVLRPALKHLVHKIETIIKTGDEIVKNKKGTLTMRIKVTEAEENFSQKLYAITAVYDENQLDLALEHYLTDPEHTDLLESYEIRENARKILKNMELSLHADCANAVCVFATTRAMSVLVAHALVLVMDIQNSGKRSVASYFSANDAELEEMSCLDIDKLLQEIPWDVLRTYSNMERRICESKSSIALLTAVISRVSCDCQTKVASTFARDAFLNLAIDPGPIWYKINVPGNEATGHNQTLSARIDTATAYWGTYHQSQSVIDSILKWEYDGLVLWENFFHKCDERSRMVTTKEIFEDHTDYNNDFRELEELKYDQMDEYFTVENVYIPGDNVDVSSCSDKSDSDSESEGGRSRSHRGSDSDDTPTHHDQETNQSQSTPDFKTENNGEISAAFSELLERVHEDCRPWADGDWFEEDSKKIEDQRMCMEFFLSELAKGVSSIDETLIGKVGDVSHLTINEELYAKYIHQKFEFHGDLVLYSAMEGPGYDSEWRGSHPLEVLISLAKHDRNDTLALWVMENAFSRLPPVLDILLADEQFDLQSRMAASEMLTLLILGSRPNLLHPSLAKTHRHLDTNNNLLVKNMDENESKSSNAKSSPLSTNQSQHYSFSSSHTKSPAEVNPIARCMEEVRTIITLFAKYDLFKCYTQVFRPRFIDGDSVIERVLHCLTAIATVAPDVVCEVLTQTCTTSLELHKWDQIDEYMPWLAPFALAINGSTPAITTFLLENHCWNDALYQDAVCISDMQRSASRLRCCFAELMSLLTMENVPLCLHIAMTNKAWADSLLSAMRADDIRLYKSIFKISLNILNSAKVTKFFNKDGRPDPRFPRDCPFDSPINLFRSSLALDGPGFEAAVHAVEVCSFEWQTILGTSKEWVNDANSGKKKPSLPLPQDESSSRNNPLSRRSLMKATPTTLSGTFGMLPPRTPYQMDLDVEVDTAISMSTTNKLPRINISHSLAGVKVKPAKPLPKIKADYQSSWVCATAFHTCRDAIDTTMMALEFMASYCEGRLEMQKVLSERSPGAFIQLPAFLVRLPQSAKGLYLAKNFEDDAMMSAFHAGAAGCVTRFIRSIVRRFAEGRVLVCQSGCVEAMMDSIYQAIQLDDEELCEQITLTIEQMIIRNAETWKYIQATCGTEGLLRLMDRGNASLRILSCSAIAHDIQKSGLDGKFFLADIVSKGVVKILGKLIVNEVADVQISAMMLTRIAMVSRKFREQVLEPWFLINLAYTLRNRDMTVIRSACRILLILGAENQTEIREAMYEIKADGEDEISQYLGATISRLVDITAGRVVPVQGPTATTDEVSSLMDLKSLKLDDNMTIQQEILSLSQAAAVVLAGMTDGDEADWPDGTPPLRPTLYASGLLPRIESI